MSQDIRDFVPQPCELLGLGEPTHQEPAFGTVRNELFAQLVELGFRSTARDYLHIESLDIAGIAGDDHRWSRDEAILDFAQSMGATPQAERLRRIGDDLRTRLYARAPELIASTSPAEWRRAKTHIDAGLGLLHYHWQAAQPHEQSDRIGLLLATRDTWMARNLLDIRSVEAARGPTMLGAHNLHLQRNGSVWGLGEMRAHWFGAGAIVDSLRVESYVFIAASLGRSEILQLGEPEPDTFEGRLQRRVTGWGLIPATEVSPGRTRTDTNPGQGYFPLDQATVDGADAIMHITG